LYEIKNIIDNEKNKKFIDDFMKRNEMEKRRAFSVGSNSSSNSSYSVGINSNKGFGSNLNQDRMDF